MFRALAGGCGTFRRARLCGGSGGLLEGHRCRCAGAGLVGARGAAWRGSERSFDLESQLRLWWARGLCPHAGKRAALHLAHRCPARVRGASGCGGRCRAAAGARREPGLARCRHRQSGGAGGPCLAAAVAAATGLAQGRLALPPFPELAGTGAADGADLPRTSCPRAAAPSSPATPLHRWRGCWPRCRRGCTRTACKERGF